MTITTLERGRAGRSPARLVHIMRNDAGPARHSHGRDPRQTWCGQAAGRHQGSVPLLREAPHELPEGRAWCPRCIGLLAGFLGRADDVARMLGLAPVPE